MLVISRRHSRAVHLAALPCGTRTREHGRQHSKPDPTASASHRQATNPKQKGTPEGAPLYGYAEARSLAIYENFLAGCCCYSLPVGAGAMLAAEVDAAPWLALANSNTDTQNGRTGKGWPQMLLPTQEPRKSAEIRASVSPWSGDLTARRT
ncbi:hypothetical protein UN63_06525 [Oceanisphaera arctica]|uniref:Uncharacterized protein n=1 Tax=Oceanisphaera arctica TaxID=641510 RepID=A0A2P5TN49_9GAMM|nr:hypothetical protein UN63_06525 [Oceanisphaera arctica]GHA07733.1 hypothetical protein GCM10007082_05760 [Oceanisphaera arctica]